MTDTIYTEGFPDGWAMIHRPDTTLLVHKGGPFSLFGSTICAAPKLRQGQEWLKTAQAIAWAVSGATKAEIVRSEAQYCDHCGVGPPCDDEGRPKSTNRAEKSWTCYYCDAENIRATVGDRPEPQGG